MHIVTRWRNYGVFLLVCVLYVGIVGSSWFASQHWMMNLEPYPDGLLYALSARSFAFGQGLVLHHQGSTLSPWVPPLYALVLSLGYRLSGFPTMFSLVNCFLGVLSFFLLWRSVWQLTKSFVWANVSVLLYASHVVLWWLPAVPMAENIFLPLFLFCLWCIVPLHPRWWQYLGFFLGALGISAIKLSLLPISLVLFAWGCWKIRQTYAYSVRMVLLGGSAVVGAFLALFWFRGVSLWSIVRAVALSLLQGNQFFSLAYVVRNLKDYSFGFLGGEMPFLWLRVPLHSFIYAGVFLLALFSLLSAKKSRYLGTTIALSLIWLAQCALLLIFYVVDGRFFLVSIPITAIIMTLGLKDWVETHALQWSKVYIYILVAVLCLSQAGTYRVLAKQIVGANLLGRTTGWQYEAGAVFDRFFANRSDGPLLITALPPFLLEAYAPHHRYRLLPLSEDQEFLNKGLHVWGSDFDDTDLFHAYQRFLSEGKEVYITNAYLTAQTEFSQAWVAYQRLFTLTEVDLGCMGTCAIYKLSLK